MAVTLDEWRRGIGKLAKSALPRAVRPVIAEAALRFEAEAKQNQGRAGLHRRTGSLFNRTSGRARFGLDAFDAEVELRVDVPYAAVHEYGATIRPKRARYLTIPLAANKTAGGDVRMAPRMIRNAFFVRSRRGNLLMMDPQRGPMFVLVNQVKVPARPYVGPARKTTTTHLRAGLAKVMREMVEAVSRG